MSRKYAFETGFHRALRVGVRLAVASALLLVGLGGPAVAIIPDWAPPEPSSDKWDWIKMASGEWLKGELDRVRDDVVYFESDKLDDLEIDLEDISLMRLGRLQAYRFDGRRIVRGTAELRGDVIRVRAADEHGVGELSVDGRWAAIRIHARG